jgi:hypothetical protein
MEIAIVFILTFLLVILIKKFQTPKDFPPGKKTCEVGE